MRSGRNLQICTLPSKFLGEVEESKIESFRTHAKKVQVSSFHLEVSELGQFPSNKNPQILWAGIKLVDEVKNLKNELVKHLSVLADLSNDHDFIPHITLARLKKTPKDILDGFYANHINFSVSSFPVNEFYLMRSELSSKGSIYKVVEAFPLNVKS